MFFPVGFRPEGTSKQMNASSLAVSKTKRKKSSKYSANEFSGKSSFVQSLFRKWASPTAIHNLDVIRTKCVNYRNLLSRIFSKKFVKVTFLLKS